MRLQLALPQVRNSSYPKAFEKRLSKVARTSVALLCPLLPLLSAPCALAQTGHRANANLRISVNVIPVVFPVPQDHRANAWWLNPLPGQSGGIVLDSFAGPPSLTLAEEVRKLSETGWDALYPAVIDHPRFAGRDEAVVRTRIVVPQ